MDEKVPEVKRRKVLPPEDKLKAYWRPLMGYTYMLICIYDFIVGPLVYNAFQFMSGGTQAMWASITLQGGGLFHLSMGAILGIAAHSRGLEKLSNK